MVRKITFLTILTFLVPLAQAQVSNPSIIVVGSAPSGSCTAGLPLQLVLTSGVLYSCQSGTWASTAGSGSFVAGGDLSGTSTSQEVTGLLSHALPSLATGYLNWTGSAWALSSVSGSGTVTSVGLTVPSWLSVSGSPVTTSGTLAVTAAGAQTQNEFLATPNGSSGPVGLRAIVAADIPTLNQSTTGNAATATNLATYPTLCSGGQFSQGLSSGSNNCATPTGGGNVSGSGTSVAGNFAVFTNTSSTAIGPGSTAYGPGSFLQVANNLSDLSSASTARTNLGLGTFATQNYATPPAIGGTTPAAGSFTTLSASSTVSGSGFSTYLASPPAIGGTAAAAGSFTTLSASSTVSGTGFSTYLASPPAIGGTTPAAVTGTTIKATTQFSAGAAGTLAPVVLGNATSGLLTLEPGTGAITSYTIQLPVAQPSGSNTYLSCTAANPAVCSWASGGGGSGLSGMTAGQVPIAATSSTVTSSEALAGSGAAIVTGPASSTSGDAVVYTGTGGQTADAGFAPAPALVACSDESSTFTPATGTCYFVTASVSTATPAASAFVLFTATTSSAGSLALTGTTIADGGNCSSYISGTTLTLPASQTVRVYSDGTNIRATCTVAAGTGTVTSVAETVPSGFSVSGSPVTTSGTLGIGYSVSAAGEIIDSTGANAAGFTATPTLGASGTLGSLTMGNATSGTVTLEPVTGALGTVTASLPANTGTLAELNYAQTWSAAQTHDSGDLILAGSSSGNTTLNAAATAGTTTATLPDNTGTIAELNLAQTWSAGQTFNNSDLVMAGSTSGTTTLEASATAGTTIATFPAATDTVVELAQTQTLTNKSIAGSEINSGTVGNTYGGTGLNSSSSSGVAQVSSGTWSVSTALANGTTATTQSAGDNSTKVATTAYANTVYNLIQTSGSPYSMSAITGLYWNNSSAAYSFDLPTPAAGLQLCFGNYKATAHAISLIPGSGVTIYFEGVAGTAGSGTGLVSGGAAGDYICLVGGDSTTYMAIGAGYGTWTNH